MDEPEEGRAPLGKMLDTLGHLLEVDVADLPNALTRSCNLVADALHADKVDAFLYEPSKDTLVALSTVPNHYQSYRRSSASTFCRSATVVGWWTCSRPEKPSSLGG